MLVRAINGATTCPGATTLLPQTAAISRRMIQFETSDHEHVARTGRASWGFLWPYVPFVLAALIWVQVVPLSEAYQQVAAARVPEARAVVDMVLAEADAAGRPVYDLMNGRAAPELLETDMVALDQALSAIHVAETMNRATPVARPVTMIQVFEPEVMGRALGQMEPRLPIEARDWIYGLIGGVAMIGAATLARALATVLTGRRRSEG